MIMVDTHINVSHQFLTHNKSWVLSTLLVKDYKNMYLVSPTTVDS